jgi:hypothetical protein
MELPMQVECLTSMAAFAITVVVPYNDAKRTNTQRYWLLNNYCFLVLDERPPSANGAQEDC